MEEQMKERAADSGIVAVNGPGSRPDLIAMSEDEMLAWYRRPGPLVKILREMRRDFEMSRNPLKISVRRRHMRPYSPTRDCPFHRLGADEVNEDACRCGWSEDEGWHFQCQQDDLDAVAVWRIAERQLLPVWWIRLRGRIGRAIVAPNSRKPVLWGGRPERKATWFERKVLGYPGLIVLGRRNYRLGESRWIYCAGCNRMTPRSTSGGRQRCPELHLPPFGAS